MAKNEKEDNEIDDFEPFDGSTGEDEIIAFSHALDVLDKFDFAMMENQYKERAETMKLKIFEMLEFQINSIYETYDFTDED